MKVCSVDGCEQPARSRGLCHNHYWHARTKGSLDDHPTMRQPRQQCTVSTCSAPRYGHGLCQTHYMRAKRNGTLDQYSASDLVAEEPLRLLPERDPVCTEAGCDEPHLALGLCQHHYNQMKYRARVPHAVKQRGPTRAKCAKPATDQGCLGPGCERKHFRLGLCRIHFNRVQRLDALEDWDAMQSTLLTERQNGR